MRLERDNSGREERQALIGVITDTAVCARVSAAWRPEGLFGSTWANTLAHLAVQYHRRYGAAPNGHIAGVFAAWSAKDHRDKAVVDAIERLLASLSDEHAATSDVATPAYTLDLIEAHANRVRRKRIHRSIEEAQAAGRDDEAQRLFEDAARNPILLNAPGLIDIRDDAIAQAAFADAGEALITYPGALGSFFGNALERDGFVAFQAPEKAGKTFWIIDVAWQGIVQRKKVAMFQAGDLSQGQFLRRWYARAARQPTRPGKVWYPTSLRPPEDGDDHARVEHKTREFADALTWQAGRVAFEQVMERDVRSDRPHFLLSCHPSGTLTVASIRSILEATEQTNGWAPDIICVDYADILAPPPGIKEKRDQINATWIELRALSQARHCLVVTATQADADSYGKQIQGRKNFSEDHRKYAHVTGMAAINIAGEEKKYGLGRLSWLQLREGEFYYGWVWHYAGCLALASPAILSCRHKGADDRAE